MNITIIGYGYVGKAFDVFFSKKYNVSVYDIRELNLERYTPKINKSDMYVVCVSTDKNTDGSVDLSGVEDVFTKICSCDKEAFVLLKSTVPPGTTERLATRYPEMHIVFSPEYIGESSYYLSSPYDWSTDVVKTPFFIFGGNKKDADKMVTVFQRIAGPSKQYLIATSLECEITKYMENTFFASKIIFCNEFYNICKVYGVDYNVVRELWLLDCRINKNHTLVFNNDKPWCFGGKCLPKDLAGIIFHSEQRGYSPKFLRCVQNCNRKKSGILMFHRIAFESSNISPIYYARKMCITIYELEKIILSELNNGKRFGSLLQVLESPDEYFLLSFDDGYSEHFEVAKYLKERFGVPKHSILFNISTDFIAGESYGMDILYSLAENNKLDVAFKYFKIDYEERNGILKNLEIMKTFYLRCTRTELQAFSVHAKNYIKKDLFLDKLGVAKLSELGTVCSHGMSHRDLTCCVTESVEEIEGSKKILQDITREEVLIFCYPEGKHNSQLIQAVKKSYKYALAINGTNDFYSICRTDGNLL